MRYTTRLWMFLGLVLLLSLLPANLATAQIRADETRQPIPGQPQLVVLHADTSSTPTVILEMYGIDANNNGMQFTDQSLLIRHGDLTARNVRVAGRKDVGTFTIFVLDITGGSDEHRLIVQQSIEQYASSTIMQEQVDFIAVYQVGELAAEEILAPTGFHNSVRNLFATPLSSQSGSTALHDTLAGLVNNGASLMPRPGMKTSIVVISDGTDQVSNATRDDLTGQAAAAGIPLHTIWLENSQFTDFAKQVGQENMSSIAETTGGQALNLTDTAGIANLWNQIASFRSHTLISYDIESPTGGSVPVQISLLDNPAIQTMVTVDIPFSAPTIQLNIPPESRSLSLPDLENPIKLGFTTQLSWLDGQERGLLTAQLLINGVVAMDVPVESIAAFDAEIGNFIFGQNSVQLAIVDNAGGRATSPEITLMLNQGEKALPPEMQPKAGLGSFLVPFGQFALAMLLVSAILVGLHRMSDKESAPGSSVIPDMSGSFGNVKSAVSGIGSSLGGLLKRTDETDSDNSAANNNAWTSPVATGSGPVATGVTEPLIDPFATIEILDSITRMPQYVDLTHTEMWLGRSPAVSDIVFENDITVSRRHALLINQESSYWLYNESQTNETFINDRPLPAKGIRLNSGDEIRLGAVLIRFLQ